MQTTSPRLRCMASRPSSHLSTCFVRSQTVATSRAPAYCQQWVELMHAGRGCATFMLKLLHYCLADPSNLPAFPSEWGAPPCLTSAERKQVPYGIASMLWSDVGATFYEKCTIGRDLPGWVLLEEENQEVVWKLQTPKEEKDWD